MRQSTAFIGVARYGILLSGAMLQGVAMALFLFPHHIPSGGAAGLVIILNHIFHLPHGWALWLINFSFLVLAFYHFGAAWTFRTMFSVTVTSYTIQTIYHTMTIQQHDVYIDLFFGAILFGLGVGLLVKHGASSGGLLIPALMIANARKLPPGRTMFWLNIAVFILAGFLINWRIVLFAMIGQWVSTSIIDLNNK
ncbi:UPF0750 membrane protein YitE [Pullulanibacillus camelliae]|uniref:UPF0750 membrane protein YitE n=1 Tax=Pullulanibacillus camelliae TaxID=1707096 RepID=A0A8J2VJ56_9BACL|nr:YitT family protein [Pullulanibacillus camelliae]GGE26238.1 UPF0750 membrane protein YitE [Pullulanibacillus camelliae]